MEFKIQCSIDDDKIIGTLLMLEKFELSKTKWLKTYKPLL